MKVFAVNSDGSVKRLSDNERGRMVTSQQFDKDDDGEWEDVTIELKFALVHSIDFNEDGNWQVNTTVRIFDGKHWTGMENYTEEGISDMKIIEEFVAEQLAIDYPEFDRGSLDIVLYEGEKSSTDGTIVEDVMKGEYHYEEIDEDDDDFYDDIANAPSIIPSVSKKPTKVRPGSEGIGGSPGAPGSGGSGGMQEIQTTKPQVSSPVPLREMNQ